MFSRMSIFIVIPLIILFSVPQPAGAEDWPLFRRDALRSGLSTEDWGGVLSLSWRFEAADVLVSSPVIAGGKVFIGSNDGNIYAIDAGTGQELWRFPTGAWVEGAPAVSGDRVFFGCMDRSVYALDVHDGTELWRYGTSCWVVTSPLPLGDTVYIGSMDHRLYALDVSDGSPRWQYRSGSYIGNAQAHSAMTGLLYLASDDFKVHALNPATGEEVWQYDAGNSIEATPVCHDGRIIVGVIDNGAVNDASIDNRIIALDAASGSLTWERPLAQNDMIYSSPVVAGGVLVTATFRGAVYGIDPADGHILWEMQPSTFATFSSLAATESMVVALTLEGKVMVLDPLTGNATQTFTAPAPFFGSPAISDQTLYIACTDGTLYAAELGM